MHWMLTNVLSHCLRKPSPAMCASLPSTTPRQAGRWRREEAVTFPLDYQFAIQQAMRRQKSASINEPDNVQLRVLFNLLGSSEAGPLLIQPILMDGEAIGAILVGNSLTRRAFT